MMNVAMPAPAEPAKPKAADQSSKDAKAAPGKFDDALSGASSGVKGKGDDTAAAQAGNDGENIDEPVDNKSTWQPDALVEELLAGTKQNAVDATDGKEKVPAKGKAVKSDPAAAEQVADPEGRKFVTDDEATLLDIVKEAAGSVAGKVSGEEESSVSSDADATGKIVADAADTLSLLSAMQTAQTASGDKSKTSERGDTQASRKADVREKSASAKDTLANDADLPTDSIEAENTYRFVSTRAGSQSVDLRIDNARNAAEFRNASSASSGVENVAVLDSRRFMGLAPSSNSASLVGLISSDGEWTSAMQPGSSLSNAAAQTSTGNVVHTLKLQLNPIDLGSVTMALRLNGDNLVVHLTVENRAAYQQLSEDSRSIVDVLRSQGYTVDQVSVSIAPTDRGANSQANGQQQGMAGQQQAAEGQNRDSGTREGSGGNRNGNGNAVASEELVRGSTAPGASGGTSAGGIYL